MSTATAPDRARQQLAAALDKTDLTALADRINEEHEGMLAVNRGEEVLLELIG